MRQGHCCGVIDVGLQWVCGGYLYRRAGRIYAEQGFDKIRHNAQLFDKCVNCVWGVLAEGDKFCGLTMRLTTFTLQQSRSPQGVSCRAVFYKRVKTRVVKV